MESDSRLANEDLAVSILANVPHEIWSPYDAYEAAAALNAALVAERSTASLPTSCGRD